MSGLICTATRGKQRQDGHACHQEYKGIIVVVYFVDCVYQLGLGSCWQY